MFACDCAEHVLPLFEEERRHDERPRQAIQTARRFLAGRATRDDLNLALNTVHSTISETRADMPWDAGLLAANAAANAASGDYRAAIWTAARAAARSPRWTPLWVRAWRARGREFGAALAKVWEIASRDEQDWQARRLTAYLAGALPEHPPYTPLSDLPARDFCHCGHTSARLD
jgi:hypothetical protein